MTWDHLYQAGLSAGLLPDQFWSLTMKEYFMFQHGFQEREKVKWTHTSSLMALHANMNAAKGKKYRPDEFNPYSERLVENQGIETKQDVLELFERAKNL